MSSEGREGEGLGLSLWTLHQQVYMTSLRLHLPPCHRGDLRLCEVKGLVYAVWVAQRTSFGIGNIWVLVPDVLVMVYGTLPNTHISDLSLSITKKTKKPGSGYGHWEYLHFRIVVRIKGGMLEKLCSTALDTWSMLHKRGSLLCPALPSATDWKEEQNQRMWNQNGARPSCEPCKVWDVLPFFPFFLPLWIDVHSSHTWFFPPKRGWTKLHCGGRD